MSQETIQWLNDNTLLGFTADKDKWAGNGFMVNGKAWWQNATFTGGFEAGIPVDEILNRLFYWQPQESEITVRVPADDIEIADGIGEDGEPYTTLIDPDRKAIVRPDTQQILGVFKSGYQIHDYEQWLLDQPASIVDESKGELGFSSAGLLRKGGVAYVTIELPDTVTTQHGDGLRPAILACTSLDGTKATTYKVVVMRPVCDNSLSMVLGGAGNQTKIKHSSRSLGRIGEVRDTLGLVYKVADEMVAFMDACADTAVTDKQFERIVQHLVPVVTPIVTAGRVENQRSVTIQQNKHQELQQLWRADRRAQHGTLAGAWQAYNTWAEHMLSQNDNKVEAVMLGTIDGTFDKADAEFWSVVAGLDIVVPQMSAAA